MMWPAVAKKCHKTQQTAKNCNKSQTKLHLHWRICNIIWEYLISLLVKIWGAFLSKAHATPSKEGKAPQVICGKNIPKTCKITINPVESLKTSYFYALHSFVISLLGCMPVAILSYGVCNFYNICMCGNRATILYREREYYKIRSFKIDLTALYVILLRKE